MVRSRVASSRATAAVISSGWVCQNRSNPRHRPAATSPFRSAVSLTPSVAPVHRHRVHAPIRFAHASQHGAPGASGTSAESAYKPARDTARPQLRDPDQCLWARFTSHSLGDLQSEENHRGPDQGTQKCRDRRTGPEDSPMSPPALAEEIATGRELGAAIAVDIEGELVVDIWAAMLTVPKPGSGPGTRSSMSSPAPRTSPPLLR